MSESEEEDSVYPETGNPVWAARAPISEVRKVPPHPLQRGPGDLFVDSTKNQLSYMRLHVNRNQQPTSRKLDVVFHVC